MRLKISDGDLVLVSFPTGIYKGSDPYKAISDSILTWVKNRGLNNVSITTICGPGTELTFQVLSVNDVFEQEVLNGNKRD